MGFSRPPILEIEARFARRVGQPLDAAVVEIARAVKDHRLDAGLARALSDEAPDFVRRLADRAPNPRLAAVLGPYSLSHDGRPLLLLAFLAEDELVRILHALALVGLGAAEVADLGGGLADLLLLDAGDDHLGRLRRHDRDPGRDRVFDVVAVAERELQHLAGDLRPIADAVDLELLLETLGDALDEVRELRAGHAPLRPGVLRLAARIDRDGAALHRHRDLLGHDEGQLALLALDLHRLAGNGRRHAGRHRDRLLANSRHSWSPVVGVEGALQVRRPCRALPRPRSSLSPRDRPSRPAASRRW